MTYAQLDFATFCIGLVADKLGMNQRDVYDKLNDSGILGRYIVGAYNPLHTFGSDYLAEDIIDYMRREGLLS